MKKSSFIPLLFATGLTLMQAGCEMEDYNLSDIDTENAELVTALGAPIGRSAITISDLLEKQDIDGLGYDSTGLIVFSYDTIQRLSIEGIKINGFEHSFDVRPYDLLEEALDGLGIDKQQFNDMVFDKEMRTLVPIIPAIHLPFDAKIAVSELIAEYDQQRIDSIILKKAPIHVTFESNIDGLLENAMATMGLRSENGDIIAPTFVKANQQLTFEPVYTLIDISNTDTIYFDGYLTAIKAMTLTVDKNSYFTINMWADDGSFEFKKVWGIFNGLETQRGSNLIDIDIYNKNENDISYNLQLATPKIDIEVNTNVGIPFRLGIDRLEAANSNKSLRAKFRDGSYSYLADLGYSKKMGDEVNAFKETFDKTNGTIDNLLNLLPTSIALDYSYAIVDMDLETKGNYFVTDDAFIDLKCSVELPAHLRTGSYIVMSDTIRNINLGEELEDETYSFDKASVTAEVLNSLPFSAKIKFIFQREDSITGKIVDILDKNIEKEIVVDGAAVDPVTKRVSNAKRSDVKLEFTGDDVPSLKKAKHMRVIYSVLVPEDQPEVKVCKDNALNVNLKAFVKGRVFINKL
ncbi:MAG: hypothetical protein MJZ23_07835 [Paludibacteraceae bacterium]|nr:hypothetical protein [Paludibacteraceae bacterium]